METFRYQFRLKNKDVRKEPHKVNKTSSAQTKKKLDLLEQPPHRRYFCQNCKEEVNICLFCDRSHKYCSTCKIKCKRNKNKKSNEKYRLTLKGKKTRAACEKRRRERQKEKAKKSDSYQIMGDPSTNIAKVLANDEKWAEVALKKINMDLKKGDNDVPVSEIQIERGDILGLSSERRNNKTIFCSYCFRECSSYTYDNLLSKNVYKKRFSKRQAKLKKERGKI